MKVLDPGHLYELHILDRVRLHSGHLYEPQWLRFVKREGVNYPGNVGKYPGTIVQDVLRCCIDRLHYVDHQIPHWVNQHVIYLLRMAIWFLEFRAAERHGKKLPGCLTHHNLTGVIEELETDEANGHLMLWQKDTENTEQNAARRIEEGKWISM